MQRKTGEKYRAEGADNVAGYADGFPFLLISEASLKELNSMIGETEYPIIMRRFRPNIVVKGTNAFEEDSCVSLLHFPASPEASRTPNFESHPYFLQLEDDTNRLSNAPQR
jgi:hypothetical protein